VQALICVLNSIKSDYQVFNLKFNFSRLQALQHVYFPIFHIELTNFDITIVPHIPMGPYNTVTPDFHETAL